MKKMQEVRVSQTLVDLLGREVIEVMVEHYLRHQAPNRGAMPVDNHVVYFAVFDDQGRDSVAVYLESEWVDGGLQPWASQTPCRETTE